MDRETFVKGQLEAVHKALTKYEVPLKPKHARRLIVGSHQERSSAVFWNAVNRIQLEKNPVMTWKFCHLLHKLIRDGHRKVPEESFRFISRIKQLGQFWKHLNTSGYGICNETYCRLLYSVMPGSLILTESQIKTLESDLDNAFEMTIDMVDQMDNLLSLQAKVYDAMECLRWSSLVPQGQCLLAPLILVILDSSKFYDYLVKMIFKLHGRLPPDALEGHRTRFRDVFLRTKKFYEESSSLQYFKYLVSIPTLPSAPPNFLQASDLDTYQTPHAYLHSEGLDDSQSVAPDEVLLELGVEEQHSQQQQSSAAYDVDPRDEQILSLTRDLEDERFAKERLIAEARSRIEQYENRLAQMQSEYEDTKREVDEAREECDSLRRDLATRDALRGESEDVRVQEANEQARLADERFGKMKAAYEKFRSEHVAESEKNRTAVLSKAKCDATAVGELRVQLAKADVEVEELRKTLEEIKANHKSELISSLDRLVDEKAAIERTLNGAFRFEKFEMLFPQCFNVARKSSPTPLRFHILHVCSYSFHVAQSALNILVTLLDERSTVAVSDTIVLAHACVLAVSGCAAAAYTSSIEHFHGNTKNSNFQDVLNEIQTIKFKSRSAGRRQDCLGCVNEQCYVVVRSARESFSSADINVVKLESELKKLTEMMTALPLQTDVDKDIIGAELENEMTRMSDAIRAAVEEIEKLQQKARINTEGIRCC
uniref:ENTH domain-containing protein n=1 Tax=Angiostrongylus cantonensis TaxID=6313 RepID=A0A158P886_ANGCA